MEINTKEKITEIMKLKRIHWKGWAEFLEDGSYSISKNAQTQIRLGHQGLDNDEIEVGDASKVYEINT